MEVQIERAPKPLDDGHRTAATIPHTIPARAAAEPAEDAVSARPP